MKSRIARIEFPFALHYIASAQCRFGRSTVVNERFLVSSVGEYDPTEKVRDILQRPTGFLPLGSRTTHLYETMIFKAKRTKNPAYPWSASDYAELFSFTYRARSGAVAGHEKAVQIALAQDPKARRWNWRR